MKVLRLQTPTPRRPTSVERTLYGEELALRDRLQAERLAKRTQQRTLARCHGSGTDGEAA